MLDERIFSGGVFSKSIEGGRAGAEIELRDLDVVGRTSEGEEFAVSYGDCSVDIGGASGRMVFCRSQDRSVTIFCEDRQFAQALSTASMGMLSEQIDAKLKQGRSRSRRGLVLGLACTVAVVGLAIGALWGIRAAARGAVAAMPVSVDKSIGSLAFDSMDLGGPEITDPAVVEALQAVVDRLAAEERAQNPSAEDFEFKVHVVDAPMVNAFALPGGKIVVFSGLLKKAENAEQVAGVLGHEMAHVTMRHGLHHTAEALGIAGAVDIVFGDASGLVGSAAELFEVASINSYSRDQELNADAECVRLLHQAGIDPASLAGFLEVMARQNDGVPDVMAWISTHPQNEERIESMRESVALLPDTEYVPLTIEWDELQSRLATSGRRE